MKIKERRILTWEKLRAICVERGWYTRGTIEEYEKLLNKTKVSNITSDIIGDIAQDIIAHSIGSMSLETTCHIIATNCYLIFEVEEE